MKRFSPRRAGFYTCELEVNNSFKYVTPDITQKAFQQLTKFLTVGTLVSMLNGYNLGWNLDGENRNALRLKAQRVKFSQCLIFLNLIFRMFSFLEIFGNFSG